jgi:hypothetical protein
VEGPFHLIPTPTPGNLHDYAQVMEGPFHLIPTPTPGNLHYYAQVMEGPFLEELSFSSDALRPVSIIFLLTEINIALFHHFT